MSVSSQTIVGKYASALYRAAIRGNVLRETEVEIAKLKAQVDLEGTKITGLIKSPLLNNNQKKKLLSAYVSKLDLKGLPAKLIDLIEANGRLAETFGIIQEFLKICESQKQSSKVIVTSSKDLSKMEQDRLLSSINQRFGQEGRMMKFSFKIDQSLMGGFVIEIDDKLIDMSVKSRINNLAV